MVFNYLGQVDQIHAQGALFEFSNEAAGRLSAPGSPRTHLLEINGAVTQGRLEIFCTYSRNLHGAEEVDHLLSAYEEALRSIVHHCRSRQPGTVTASDFPLAELDQEEFHELLEEIDFDL